MENYLQYYFICLENGAEKNIKKKIEKEKTAKCIAN